MVGEAVEHVPLARPDRGPYPPRAEEPVEPLGQLGAGPQPRQHLVLLRRIDVPRDRDGDGRGHGHQPRRTVRAAVRREYFEPMTLSDELRIALDGKWRHVREQSRHRAGRDGPRLRPRPQPRRGARAHVPPAQGARPHRHAGAPDSARSTAGAATRAWRSPASRCWRSSTCPSWSRPACSGACSAARSRTSAPSTTTTRYIRDLINLDLVGCFAMTETGHGSDVQNLETTATYDPATEEFVINSPTPSSRKDYIGNAGKHATMAAVFAQLITTRRDVTACTASWCRSATSRATTSRRHDVRLRPQGRPRAASTTAASCSTRSASRARTCSTSYGQVDEGGAYSSPIDDIEPTVLHDARHARSAAG